MLVSRHFFRETLRTSLRVLLHQTAAVAAGMDPDIRAQLSLRFKEQEISELTSIELLVVNDGRLAISHYVNPLTVRVPPSNQLLDAALLHVHPKGRDVVVKTANGAATIDFDVLNAGEFFLLKLLVSGQVAVSQLQITMSAPNLPPNLDVSYEDYVTSAERQRFDTASLAIAAVIGSLSAGVLGALWLLWRSRPSISPVPWSDFDLNLFGAAAVIVSAALGLILALISFMALMAAALGGSFPKRRWLPLPEEFRPAPRFIPRHELPAGTRVVVNDHVVNADGD